MPIIWVSNPNNGAQEWVPALTSATTTATQWWPSSPTATATASATTAIYPYGALQWVTPTQIYSQQLAAMNALAQGGLYEEWQSCRWLGVSTFIAASPSIIMRQDAARRDEELYRRALAEHDVQEAARLLRAIEARAVDQETRRRLFAEHVAQRRQEVRRRAAATARANGLLRENLTPQQRETFDRNGWFVVEGGRTKQKYRIRSGTVVANVDVIGKDERTMHRLCGHVPVDRVPHGDQLLAQKIMIELAEDEFLRIANRHGREE